jgi:hypothetical protein
VLVSQDKPVTIVLDGHDPPDIPPAWFASAIRRRRKIHDLTDLRRRLVLKVASGSRFSLPAGNRHVIA